MLKANKEKMQSKKSRNGHYLFGRLCFTIADVIKQMLKIIVSTLSSESADRTITNVSVNDSF